MGEAAVARARAQRDLGIRALVSICTRGRDDGRHALAGRHRRPDDDAELDPARAGHVRPVLGRRRLHPLGGAPGPPSIGEHGHARRGRDARGLGLQRRGHGRAGARHGCRHRAGHLLRLGRDDRRAHPCGSLARGADARTGWRRDGEPRRAAATDRARHPRHDRAGRADRGRACGRPVAGPTRREGPRGRRRHRWRVDGRRVDADRRGDAGGEGTRRPRDRGDPERERLVHVPSDAGRRRHRPRAHRPARSRTRRAPVRRSSASPMRSASGSSPSSSRSRPSPSSCGWLGARSHRSRTRS